MNDNANIVKQKWDTSHRPWPLPNLPWTMRQNWCDLLFIHYPIRYDVLRKLVPDCLPLDSYDGTYWIGVVPFRMSGVRLRGVPAVPGTSQFPELNVRTYVTIDGKPGVYFFSLDASNLLAVKSARTLYHLPYSYAQMSIRTTPSYVSFQATRRAHQEVVFAANYKPISAPFQATPGSFEQWMSERYCFYTINKSGLPLRCDILHEPWTLQKAAATIATNTMLTEQGIDIERDVQPILHFAKKIEVRAWPLVNPFTNRVMH